MIVVAVDHKCCSMCRDFRSVEDFYAKVRSRDGTVRTWQSRCKDCMREAGRMRLGISRRGKPYQPRKRRTRRQQRDARRRQHRAQRRRETAAERTTRCVLARIDAKLRRDAALEYPQRRHWRDGMSVAEPYRPTLAPDEWLDPAPFVAWLNRRYPGVVAEEVALSLGVTARTVRALLTGEQHSVSLTFVDRAVTHIGRPDLLNDIYPL